MGIRSILASIFGSNDEQGRETSPGEIARKRLELILLYDEAEISPGMMDNMKQEVIEVIKKYFKIDESQINLVLEKEDGSVALVANIPIKTEPRPRRRT